MTSHILEALESLTALHEYKGTPTSPDFYGLLRSAYLQLCSIFSFQEDELDTIHLSTSILPSLSMCFSSISPSVTLDDISYSNIFSFLRSEPHGEVLTSPGLTNNILSSHSRIHELLVPYVDPNNPYSYAAQRLMSLCSHLSDSSQIKEDVLVDYISKCFSYEISYFTGLNSQLNTQELDMNVSTEQLVSSIDNYIKKSIQDNPLREDKASSHDNLHYSQADSPLNFHCSDRRFDKLYHIFLQLILFKSPTTYNNTLHFTTIMISFYKQSCDISCFCSNSPSKTFIDFLSGTDLERGIVPYSLRYSASDYLNKYMSSNTSVESFVPEAHLGPKRLNSEESSASKSLLKSEIVDLLSNFKTVISILNEYGLEFEPSFPFAFRHYVYLVYEKFPDLPINDDYEFIDEVVNTMNAIVNYVNSDNESGHDTFMEIVDNLRLIQEEILEVSPSSTLLMRSAAIETSRFTLLAKTLLRRWNYKALAAQQLGVIYNEEVIPKIEKRQLKQTFLMWKLQFTTNTMLYNQAFEYSDKKLIANYFNEKWLRSLILIMEINKKASEQQCLRAFKQWSQTYVDIKDRYVHVAQQSDLRVVRDAFDQLIRQGKRNGELNEKANILANNFDSHQNMLYMKRAYNTWRTSFQSSLSFDGQSVVSSSYFASLDERYRKYILKKYLKTMVVRFRESQACELLQNFKDRSLKMQMFKILLSHYTLIQMRNSIELKRNLSLMQTAFSTWHHDTQDRVLADLTYRKNILRKSFLYWKIRKLELGISINFNDAVVKDCFKAWILQLRKKSLTTLYNRRLCTQAFTKWKDSYGVCLRSENTAANLHDRNTALQTMTIWSSRTEAAREMMIVADLNVQRKFLNLILSSMATIQRNQAVANEFLDSSNLVVKLSMKAAIRCWKEAYLAKYERESDIAVSQFHINIRSIGTQSVFFKYWRTKLSEVREKQRVLDSSLEIFHSKNALKNEVLLVWLEKLHAYDVAMESAKVFFDNLSYKNMILLWYEKFITKSVYLSDIADELIDKRDYNQMVDFLRKWNLKFTKNVKRNQQTCEMFTEKWEKAKLHSILEIWIFRTKKKTSPAGEFVEANSTMGSNISPLSKRYSERKHENNISDGEIYLFTPMKKQFTQLPFTPADSNSSPSRLQETNQRMKNTRIDASINRYRHARRGKSKTATKLQSSELTKLSPPKTSGLRSRLRASPPPAPNFNDYFSSRGTPEATSSPSSFIQANDRDVDFEPSTFETDEAILETAKQMQKIKPVRIPREEEYTPIKYSPVSKLRERLITKAGSPPRLIGQSGRT